MKMSFDFKGFDEAETALKQVPLVVSQKFIGGALRVAGRPMLDNFKSRIPIGDKKSGEGRDRRGGATYQDARIKIVYRDGEGIVRMLMGVSKAKGKVGWRFGYIDKSEGFRTRNGRRIAGGQYLERAGVATAAKVEARFYQLVGDRVQKNLAKGGFR